LDFQHLKWAGHGLPDDMSYQFVELEVLKPEEYDHFIFDMSDFMARRYWPRVNKALAAFEKLPPLNAQISYFWGLYGPTALLDPEMKKAVEALFKAAEAGGKILSAARAYGGKLKEMGFPPSSGAYTQAPFDTLSDVFRGTKGLMMDMRRRPDKVMAACEKLLPVMLDVALTAAKASGCPIVFIPLHKCMDTFMSQAQFEKFYWPHFRQLLHELISNGLTPWVLMEGVCNDRLNSFRDVPAGKMVWHIEGSDIRKVKEAFRGVACVRGNLPVSVLVTGSPDDVRAECKKLLDLMKEDGGFIFDTGVNIGDAKIENVDAMFEYVREHGVY
jgi:uroporphyrinogen-III decarboxylase